MLSEGEPSGNSCFKICPGSTTALWIINPPNNNTKDPASDLACLLCLHQVRTIPCMLSRETQTWPLLSLLKHCTDSSTRLSPLSLSASRALVANALWS